jgi:hypothetical protein
VPGIEGQQEVDRAEGLLGEADLFQPDRFVGLQVEAVEPKPLALGLKRMINLSDGVAPAARLQNRA